MQEWVEALRAAGMQPQPSNYPMPYQQGQTAYPGQPFQGPSGQPFQGTPGYPGQPFPQGQTAVPSNNNLPNAIM